MQELSVQKLRIVCGWTCGLLLGMLLSPAATAAPADSGFVNEIRAHLAVENNETESLGAQTAYIGNFSGMTLHFQPDQVEDWPVEGNGIEARVDPFDLAPGAVRAVPFTVRTNTGPRANPFVMSRKVRMLVTDKGRPERQVPWTLALSARVNVEHLLRVTAPAVGEAESYICAAAPLEHTPPHLWPVHCRNALPDEQADRHPLILRFSVVRPSDLAYIRPLPKEALYQVQDVDATAAPPSAAQPSASQPSAAAAPEAELEQAGAQPLDLAQGSQTWSVTPQPGRSFRLTPVVPGLPRISRREHHEEADVVLELERRPDLMDPRTRVDTVRAACIGDDCGDDNAIVIDAIERVDDIGHGFDAPPPDEAGRYAPDGLLQPGTRLSPGGSRDKAEVAWRITDDSQGAYVESHYVIRYHDREGRQSSLRSSHFGGIVEPSPQRAHTTPAVLRGDPPWWAHEQLPGPFMSLTLPDSSGQRQSVPFATPALDSRIRLISVMQVAPNLGSASIIGMPSLNADGSIRQIKVLGALHVLLPLFYNGLSAAEYRAIHHGPIELAVSEAWFDRGVDWNDPVRTRLVGWSTLGHAFDDLHFGAGGIGVDTVASGAAMVKRMPDVVIYTIQPHEKLQVDTLAVAQAPTLVYAVTPMLLTQPRPLAFAGYPQGANYQVQAQGKVPVDWMPMTWAELPALDLTFSPSYPANSHFLRMGRGDAFSYTRFDPSSGAVVETGNTLTPLHGVSGSAMLGSLHWSGSALSWATVHGVASSAINAPAPGGEKLLSYVGFDVDVADPDNALLYGWLSTQLF